MSVWAGLIERLEKATEGSRELDVLIAYMGRDAELIGIFEPETIGVGNATACLRLDGKRPAFIKMGNVPAYTSSLDAALTLVPEGWRWQLRQDPSNYTAIAHRGAMALSDIQRAHAATPAIALCIASIKARASHGVDEPG